MNYCFEIEAQALILVVEARFGRSTLQNLNQYSTTSTTARHTGDSGWLLNGQSFLRYKYNNTYQLSNPLLDNRITAIMIYATEPVVTLNTRHPLQLGSYGLNMQVLNHNTTAMLDPPTRHYLQSLRNNMRQVQTVYLRASVNATFSSVNCTNVDNSCRRPAGFFDSTSLSHAAWESTVNFAGASNIKFTMEVNKAQQEVLFISAWDESADPPASISSELIGFNLYRGHCDGRWRNLQQVLADAMVTASNDPIPKILPTRFSAQSAIVPSMVWSKLSFDVIETMTTFFSHYPELNYVTESCLQASVQTLKQNTLLFVVLCIQPVIVFIFMIIRYRLRHTPISNEFGLVSLLAGIHPNSVRLLKGASFSGVLNAPAGLTINVIEDGEADGHRSGHLEYVLNTEIGSKSGLLVKGVSYY
ncbi:f5c67cd1-2945-45ff-b8ee-b647bf488242 [Sclerotinia trifoliorum]|uniref:F5c67cd1-2945-45ff-b8ee-b647bf488242 n=1 Tax=Sclerotinia trifoliorum TaxID=28548 RepID=A0A8H2ZSI2_9HELO|nr:f5c67cd1-2945-45ff-b8ee-b647bf488242 [Sclerotinia trifoliorum]